MYVLFKILEVGLGREIRYKVAGRGARRGRLDDVDVKEPRPA